MPPSPPISQVLTLSRFGGGLVRLGLPPNRRGVQRLRAWSGASSQLTSGELDEPRSHPLFFSAPANWARSTRRRRNPWLGLHGGDAVKACRDVRYARSMHPCMCGMYCKYLAI